MIWLKAFLLPVGFTIAAGLAGGDPALIVALGVGLSGYFVLWEAIDTLRGRVKTLEWENFRLRLQLPPRPELQDGSPSGPQAGVGLSPASDSSGRGGSFRGEG